MAKPKRLPLYVTLPFTLALGLLAWFALFMFGAWLMR